jgi:hypothetical protein
MRDVRCVTMIIGCLICSAILAAVVGSVVAAVVNYKTQRNLPAYESHSATNPAPFDRRRRPICKPDSAVKE